MWRELRLKASLLLNCAALLLVLLFGFSITGAAATEATGMPKYVSVPVYYLTDRNLDGTSYGNRRRYETNCLHRMYYGTAWVTVENHNHENNESTFKALGWKPTDARPDNFSPKDQIDPSRPLVGKREFFRRLQSAMDKAATDHLCVYVHGAEEGFEEALSDAAEFAYVLRRPLVLYSWPSTPKLLDYAEDNGNAEWSQGHFFLFCRDLVAFKETHPIQLILLAHSMGNRFIFRSIHALYANQLISDCELISPDMDIDTCRHYLIGFRRIDNNTTIRLYISHKDRMLRLSQKLFGGYARLGQDVQSKLVPNRSVEQVTVRKSGGEKNSTQNAERADGSEVMTESEFGDAGEGGAAFDAALQRIDFTAIDKGLTGHSIPFQLVANFVNGRGPGAGLAVVGDESDKSKRSYSVIQASPQPGAPRQPK